jgi:outer membrane protein OmpA-like peptidoglycan-associated protein
MSTRSPASAFDNYVSLAGVVAMAGLLLGCEALEQPGATASQPSVAEMRADSVPGTSPGARAPSPSVAAPPAKTAATVPPAGGASAAPPPSPPPVLPFEQAVQRAAQQLLGDAKLPPPAAGRYALVIDPLIDGVTGSQSNVTRSMGAHLTKLIQQSYSQFDVQKFSGANVKKGPLVLIGTFTGVNAQRQTSGVREAYRICLALADLTTGKLVSKGLAFADTKGVDPTPLAYFRDTPAWTEDPATLGYIRTCQGTKAGDPINPMYVDRILVGAMISDAIDAYSAARYKESLDLFESASRIPEGNQLRVYNGLYLANWKLGRRAAATQSFGRIVDYGLQHDRLAAKFLFRPGSTAFFGDAAVTEPYSMWLKEIATRTSKVNACLEITGHTSPTGPEPLNERLSLLRADYIKKRLQTEAPPLSTRAITNGVGSKEAMVGNGRDDTSDALDRRVEFKVISC